MAKPTKVLFAVLAALLLTSTAAVVMLVRSSSHHAHASNAPDEHAALAMPVAATISSGTQPADAAVVTPDARAAERAAMLEAIARARSHRTTVAVGPIHATHAATATTGDSTGTTLDIEDKTGDTSDWEKRALGTVNSLFGQCYDLGRAEDPAFAGTITVRFTLVAEPNVGGLLDQVEIVDDGTSITQQTFRDCITQQLYALELDPPPNGVTVKREIKLKL